MMEVGWGRCMVDGGGGRTVEGGRLLVSHLGELFLRLSHQTPVLDLMGPGDMISPTPHHCDTVIDATLPPGHLL